ncbi:hypothetical protein [Peribacillus sp. ACCC06369]|uniref:hypothetical protein n=1 Tax=Peribacillus sp. ACCC06369 TaxID=3055860 RepID=UPI0025A000BC|nr:hypothetical protein [Peribacillus sp. ACCC06369]MDM5358799.1 hypothetical protein [Peribacillus sp. ACCC06369]
MRTSYRRWTEYPYQGESIPPKGSPEAGNWSMFIFSMKTPPMIYKSIFLQNKGKVTTDS